MGKRSARKKAKKRYAYYINKGREIPPKTVGYSGESKRSRTISDIQLSSDSDSSYRNGYEERQRQIDEQAALMPLMTMIMNL